VKQLNVSFQIGDNLSVDVISCSKFDKNWLNGELLWFPKGDDSNDGKRYHH
jgi:hypothetical protein